jgi:HPt (histidine-containing phosphotransfer) domain-containing protein
MSELEMRLEGLRLRFIAGLGQRMANVERSWAEADHESAQRALHSLAGTAGTYRLAEVAAAAVEAETAIENGRNGEAAAFLRRLRELLAGYAVPREESAPCP